MNHINRNKKKSAELRMNRQIKKIADTINYDLKNGCSGHYCNRCVLGNANAESQNVSGLLCRLIMHKSNADIEIEEISDVMEI